MSDNKTLGKKIIEAAGGAENIKSITNCATRLRMYIKDASKYDEESIKKLMELWEHQLLETSIRLS